MRGGPTIYGGGGGVQMLISIEFDRTCDLPGMGSGPPTPHPLDPHMHDIKRLKNKVERGRIGSPGRREHLRFLISM